jgi:predicted Zn-dependent protease
VITFKGTYFDGKNSRAHHVTASAAGNVLSIRGEDLHEDYEIGKCTFEPALGKTRRTLYTPDGGRLDTADHESFSTLERKKGGTMGFRIVHVLESHWKAALVSVAVAVLAVVAASMWGIPYLAEKTAFALPDSALKVVGKGALDSADRHFLSPSELDTAQQERVRSLVITFVAQTGARKPQVLVFRKSPFGPNAFALPGDTVVLTDELIEFVEKDEEIIGVVAHELAHLERRHAVRSVLQGAGIFIMVSILVGDVASITSTAGTLPALLLETGYSRRFEEEADHIASQWMMSAGYGVEPMIAFLTRIKEKEAFAEGPEFLSTHPATEKRISYLRELAGEGVE